jgi:hypothetical protein
MAMFSVGFGRALFHTPLEQQRVCACEKFNRREICPDGRRLTALSQPRKLAELLELLELLKLLKLLKLTVGAAEGCDLLILKTTSKDRSLRQLLHGLDRAIWLDRAMGYVCNGVGWCNGLHRAMGWIRAGARDG